jgi:hypothetical protein
MAYNPFLGLDSATIATLKAETLDGIKAALRNQSYTIEGKSVARAELKVLNETLGQLVDAQKFNSGETTDTTFISMNGN